MAFAGFVYSSTQQHLQIIKTTLSPVYRHRKIFLGQIIFLCLVRSHAQQIGSRQKKFSCPPLYGVLALGHSIFLIFEGIGRATVILLAKCGANIVALSRTKSDLDSLKTEVSLSSVVE